MEIIEIEKANLPKYSPIKLLAEKLGLKFVVRENNLITGPAVGLAGLVDRITSLFPVKSMLDLCCGTGALSKIALLNGVEKVVCVDTCTKAVEENLKEFKEKVEIVECNVFKFNFHDFFDLIVIDPPQELIQKLLKKFVPFVKKKCNIFVIWHGNGEEEEWNSYVRERLRKMFGKIIDVGCWGEEITCCSFTQQGRKWLDELFRKW